MRGKGGHHRIMPTRQSLHMAAWTPQYTSLAKQAHPSTNYNQNQQIYILQTGRLKILAKFVTCISCIRLSVASGARPKTRVS